MLSDGGWQSTLAAPRVKEHIAAEPAARCRWSPTIAGPSLALEAIRSGEMPEPDPTLRITRLSNDGLVIDHARRLAEAFFEIDPSSRMAISEGATHAYDDWSMETRPHGFEPYDLKVLNTSMRARSPERWWTTAKENGAYAPQPLLGAGDLAWLVQVEREADLFMPEDDWVGLGMAQAIEALMLAMLRKGIDVSVATKALHLKRPWLMPVLDSLVIAQLGTRVSGSGSKRETRARQAAAIVVHLREQGLAVREDLELIQVYLRDVVGRERSLVRILDALLWSSHPGSLIAPVSRLIERWGEEGTA
jgi:hypothetical protein